MMDPEFANDVRVARDRMGLSIGNSQAEDFARAVLAALASAVVRGGQSRFTVSETPGAVLFEIRLGRGARLALVQRMIDDVLEPPAPAPKRGPAVTVE